MKRKLHRYAIHIGRATLHVGRWAWYASAGVLALAAVVFTLARLLLPGLAEKKADLEEYLSRKSTYEVRIEKLGTYWDGLSPGLHVQGLRVFAKDSLRPAIRLGDLRISLALLPLLQGDVVINSLVLSKPRLAFERLADGRFRISGFDPIRTGKRNGDEKFVSWLFKQKRLVIRDGELQWFDHMDPAAALYLSRVNMDLRNAGDRHRLGISAVFPSKVCRDCSLIMDITGNPLINQKWGGDIYLRAAGLNLSALPLIAREKMPSAFKGKFNVQLWTKWKKGRPHSVQGNMAVSRLRLPIPGLKTPVLVRQSSAEVNWRGGVEEWRLELRDLMLGLSRPSWSAGLLRISHGPSKSSVQVGYLDIDDLAGFISNIKKENKFLKFWASVKPGGAVNNLKIDMTGAWSAPEDFSLEADVARIKFRPYKKFPGVQNLSGRLVMRKRSGEFYLDSTDFVLDFPRVFRSLIDARRVSGRVNWEKMADHWQIKGNDLRVISDDGRGIGKMMLRVPVDRTNSPFLKLRVDFNDGNGAHAKRYYPPRYLSPRTLAWMEWAFAGGHITSGYLVYEGNTREFPFRDGNGRFIIRGHVRDGVYNYLQGWTPIKKIEADVIVNNNDILVTGYGKIGELDLNQVVVQAQFSAGADRRKGPGAGRARAAIVKKKRNVRVSGKLLGPVNEALKILRGIEPEEEREKWAGYIPSGLQGTGNGSLSLNLSIPVPNPEGVGIRGEYRFLNGGLMFSGTKVGIDAIEGRVQFTEAGIQSGNLRGKLLGEDMVLTAMHEKGKFLVHAQGRITAHGFVHALAPRIAKHVIGGADWYATWRSSRGRGYLNARVELQDIKTNLPPPLNRPKGIVDRNLIIKTELAGRNRHIISLGTGNRIRGKLVFDRRNNIWGFSRGRIGFGEKRTILPKGKGLHLGARIDAVDIDQWWPLLGDGAGNIPDFLTRISAQFKSFDMLDRRFGKLSLDMTREKNGWSSVIRGTSAVGKARIIKKKSATEIYLDLARLRLPNKKHRGEDTDVDPRKLPTLGIRSKSFQMRGKKMGRLDFLARPVNDGWEFVRLNMTRPEMKLRVNGKWRIRAGKHASVFDITFNSSDMGKTMEAFGVPDQMAKGKVEVKSTLSWAGSPTNPKLAKIDGKIELTAKKGRFLKVDQGASRLFGLLDLSSIGRYLVLDFSPLFGKGFIFNKIEGHISVERGNAYTRDFTIRAPSAKLAIGGRIGLVEEDYDLVLKVQPRLSDSLTLTSLGIWGPQIAVAVLAIQKVFKKQIAEGTRVTYVVKGPWDDPKVIKSVEKEKPKADAKETETESDE